mmetsp:Transcript_23003/g.34273  ORF Transcript_23003/g.34273 Transcript_23003/m.34273 type:complete len:540 (-) Transcript_23003:52-1671(-)
MTEETSIENENEHENVAGKDENDENDDENDIENDIENDDEIEHDNDNDKIITKESFSDTEKGDGNESVHSSKGENENEDDDDNDNENGDDNDNDNDDKDGNNGNNEGGSHQEEKEDEDSKNDEDAEEQKQTEEPIMLGGPLDKQQEAYALLTGQYEDIKEKESTKTIINVPITALPAILGRTQKITNEHIFDLGNCKALSRKHAVIFYSDPYGGKLGKYTDKNEDGSDNTSAKIHKVDNNWYYKSPPAAASKKVKAEDVIRPEDVDLPQSGFFAIECISKNKLFVNKKRVEQGQVALLNNGTTIKMAGYCLYFLLPEDITTNAISLPHPIQQKDHDSDDEDGNAAGPPSKKIKRENSDILEGKTLTELLDEFIQAVDNDIFERKHSLISSGIMYHAVQDVMNCASLQKTSKEENGVSRTEIMDWIGNNEQYKPWVIKLLTKLEMKSYQANLSKAMIKAGFTRIGTTGRHVKWLLPSTKTKKGGDKKKKQTDKNPTVQKKSSNKDQSAENDSTDKSVVKEEGGNKSTEEEIIEKVDLEEE